MNAEDQQYYDAFKDSGAETGYVVPPTIEKIQSDLNNMAEMYKGTFKGKTKKQFSQFINQLRLLTPLLKTPQGLLHLRLP